MGARQMSEWLAFIELGYLPEHRSDLRMGILASLIANANRDVKRKATPFRPSDFIPRIKEEEDALAEARLKASLDSIAKPRKR